MKVRRSNGGFAHLVLILAVVVIAVVGFAGYYVLSAEDKKSSDNTAETSQVIPDKINSSKDLEQASSALDADQNDQDLDPAQLDDDLNSLL